MTLTGRRTLGKLDKPMSTLLKLEETTTAPRIPQAAENHLQKVKAETLRMIDSKYRKGQIEHGGVLPLLTTKQLVNEAIEEAIDQVIYLLTIRDQIAGGTMVMEEISGARA